MMLDAFLLVIVLGQDIGEKQSRRFNDTNKPEAEKEYRVGTHHLNSYNNEICY